MRQTKFNRHYGTPIICHRPESRDPQLTMTFTYGSTSESASASGSITIGRNGLPELLPGQEVAIGQDITELTDAMWGDLAGASGVGVSGTVTDVTLSSNGVVVWQNVTTTIEREEGMATITCNVQQTYTQQSDDTIYFVGLGSCLVEATDDSGGVMMEVSATYTK